MDTQERAEFRQRYDGHPFEPHQDADPLFCGAAGCGYTKSFHDPLPTPVLDKLAAEGDRRSAVSDFLEWLSEEESPAAHIHLARWVKYSDSPTSGEYLTYITERPDDLIMRWLDIDPKDVERERRALLADLPVVRHA